MLFIYKNNNNVFVTTEKLFNFTYDLLELHEEVEIKNVEFKMSRLETHTINSNLYPCRYGYICILDCNYKLKLFEQFDVLKEYSISETDFVFEIYKINGITKVFPYPFAFDRFYIQCDSCLDITMEPILKCKKCNKGTCIGCNIFKDVMCDTCTIESI